MLGNEKGRKTKNKMVKMRQRRQDKVRRNNVPNLPTSGLYYKTVLDKM